MFDFLPLSVLPSARFAATAGVQGMRAGVFFDGAPPGVQVNV